MSSAARNSHDHRLRQAIVETEDRDLFPELAIPESTRRTWMRRGVASVVSIDRADADLIELHARNARLQKRVAILVALVRLLVTLVRARGLSIENARVPTAVAKGKILRAVATAEPIIGRAGALKIIGLSEGRLRSWNQRQTLCMLDDAPPCPRTKPGRLTRDELTSIRAMIESEEFKHFSLRSLSLYAQRLGTVLASYGTWCRMLRQHGWRRPRRRLYPAKPKVGICATRPNEWFHIDVTIIRLLDGTRCFLHAVMDGFSRRVLAWTLQPKLGAEGTRRVLTEALALVSGAKVNVLTDGGCENTIIGTDEELGAVADHVVAQVDVVQSNSMIEALWSQLRHRWLYLHSLDSFARLEHLIAAYFNDHNTKIPTVALGGRTPDEVYFAREPDLPRRLHDEHVQAQRARIETNRKVTCSSCSSVNVHHATPGLPPGSLA